MDHMNHMDQAAQFAVPLWLIYSMATLFFAGACFYLYRLLSPTKLKSAYGYHDRENEIGHGLCMLAMSASLAPASLQLPALLWAVLLSLGGSWFFVRALTWGRQLPYNKWWYDWAHVGMLLGMALMFYPLSLGAWFVALQVAFWSWFSAYYSWQICKDLPSRKIFYIGSDVSHFAMGAVMLLMTLFPAAMMPAHGHDMHNMSTVSPPSGVAAGNQQHKPAVKDGNTYVVDDTNFSQEVLTGNGPVIVLVFGGCEKCAQEVHVFDDIAGSLGSKAKFVRVNKDNSPNACKQLSATECPKVFIVTKNGITPLPVGVDVTDPDQLRTFIADQVK